MSEEKNKSQFLIPSDTSRLSLVLWLMLLLVGALIVWAHFSIVDETARSTPWSMNVSRS